MLEIPGVRLMELISVTTIDGVVCLFYLRSARKPSGRIIGVYAWRLAFLESIRPVHNSRIFSTCVFQEN